MAKIVITVDTSDKSLAVTIDGTKIENVKSVNAYQYRDSDGNAMGIDASVNVSEASPSPDVSKETSYYAMGSVEGEKVMNSGKAVYNKDMPQFVGLTCESKAQADIAAYLATKLGKS